MFRPILGFIQGFFLPKMSIFCRMIVVKFSRNFPQKLAASTRHTVWIAIQTFGSPTKAVLHTFLNDATKSK